MSAVADIAASATSMDIGSALRDVLRESLYVDGISRGVNESVKIIESGKAKLCVVAKDCEDGNYTKLVEALCKDKECPLVKVDDKKVLGEMAGLCKIDKDGQARKVVQCSCVVVQEFGKDTPGRDYLLSQSTKE